MKIIYWQLSDFLIKNVHKLRTMPVFRKRCGLCEHFRLIELENINSIVNRW